MTKSKERKFNSVTLHEDGKANGVQKASIMNRTEQRNRSLCSSKISTDSSKMQKTGNEYADARLMSLAADDIATLVFEPSHSGSDEDEEEMGQGCCGRKHKKKSPTVGFLDLFQYSGPVEIFVMVLGTVGAIVTGCAQPISILFFGETVNVFINASYWNFSNSTETNEEVFNAHIHLLILNFLILGCVTLVTGYISVSMWTWAGERQINKIRKLFFHGVMRQDIGWFDMHEVGEINSRFSDDMYKIREGMGDKVPIFLQWICTWICAYMIAFIKGGKLSLVVFAFSPFIVTVAGSMSWLLSTMTVKELNAYAKAGAEAEQALRAIRTVHAFQGQEKEEKKYNDSLVHAKTVGTRKGLVLGLGTGFFWTTFFITFAVAFYYGVVLIQDEGMDPGNVLVVFFCVLFGSIALGHAFPDLESFTNARAAAVKIFNIISHHPIIDISSTAGKTLATLNGVIEFKNIHFRYPARPEVQILKGLNLTVNPGQTVALVGASGCGKSTTIQLLQRYYDPEYGQVTVDGHDIKDLNLRWLRDQMGVVCQEPVLFASTIAENIRYGQPEATQEQVKAAAKEANAHDFITKLPKGYKTLVGERGAQLSGGQKQRIAIARALVRNPRILLLDEATSALDNESEAVVQNALERAQKGRTTIVIAHRLSTICNADKIVVISRGRKREEGSHDQLMAINGLYAQLVKLQLRAEERNEDVQDIQIIEEDDEHTSDFAACPKLIYRSCSVQSEKSITRSGGYESGHRKSRGPSSSSEVENKSEKEIPQVGVMRLLRLNAPEWVAVLLGTTMAIICGLSLPCFAFVFGEFLNGYFFAKSGSELTARLRSLTFHCILKQDMSFFDEWDNEVGNLTTRLSSDAALVQGATGSKIGIALEATATIVAALVIAFTYGWKLTQVILAFLPILIIAGRIQGSIITGSAKSEKIQLQEAGKICSEAVDNIHSVVSLNREDIFIDKLEKLLNSTSWIGLKTAQLYGITYGLSDSIQYFATAAAFAFGSDLVVKGEMEFFNIFRVISAIVMSGTSVGRNSSLGVDYRKALLAAGRLFAIIDKKPKIDIDQTDVKHLDNYRGRLGLQKVVFHYPTRQTVQVLSGLTVNVEPGQTLALIGGSGCGKSTVLQLLQRFYDPDYGAVLADNHDLRTLDLRWFRQQLGIVFQEPTLFDDSIAGNIAYGDNSRQVSMDEIIGAARAANIHDFIQELPQGYDTNVGDKGTQLSGGQKQRIAIARALVRRPKVLLLDEATSALDTESERIVQEALDKARKGRTCIVVAHRLTTIQNADRIAVLKDGCLQEIGTHRQLMAKQGSYFQLLHVHSTLSL